MSELPTDIFVVLLTSAPFNYAELKKLRAVCSSWKEIIDTSANLDARLFRMKPEQAAPGAPTSSHRAVKRLLHPAMGKIDVMGRKLDKIVVFKGPSQTNEERKEWPVMSLPIANEQLTSPPSTSVTYRINDDVPGDDTITDPEGVKIGAFFKRVAKWNSPRQKCECGCEDSDLEIMLYYPEVWKLRGFTARSTRWGLYIEPNLERIGEA